jgi:hypothetical protein
MQSRRDRIYNERPELVSGYELSPEKSYFSVIIPEATTNLVTNPSIGGGVTTGYAAVGGAMVSTTDWQAYGAYGLKLTPAVSTESGFYFGTVALASGSVYTASIVFQGDPGKLYYLYFGSTAGAVMSTKKPFRANGRKQRISVTWTETAGASRRVYLVRDAQYTDQNVFYADGLQVEEKGYPTTYTDGDQKGFVVNQNAYLWTGTPHASASTRSAQTRSGGVEMNLLDLGLRISLIVGLGMAPVVNQSLAIPGFGGLFQGVGNTEREFTLAGTIYADGPRHLEALRAALVDAVKPDLTTIAQPLILRFQGCDDDGEVITDSLDIVCNYSSGLEQSWDNHHGENLALNFTMFLPFVKSTYSSGISLGFQTTVADANYILQRGSNGIWAAMGTGAVAGMVNAIVSSPNGMIYAGGAFTSMGGVADTAYIAAWNGSAWSALGTGMNGIVRALAVGPDGSLYAGGDFFLAGGVANTVRVAKWDGTVWTPLATGANNTVFALEVDKNGILYAGGDFLNLGSASGDYIAKWNGAAWSALGTGGNSTVLTIKSNLADGSVYAGGIFTSMGGVTGTPGIAKWNGTTWSALGTGVTATVDVRAIAIGPDGSVYAGGNFTSMSGIAGTSRIAKWNGVNWSALGTGMDDTVFALEFDTSKNEMYAGGNFTVAGAVALPDSSAKWNGAIWMPLDVDLPNVTPGLVAIKYYKPTDTLYFGFANNGNAISATVQAQNLAGATSYPIVTFTGPGTLWQLKNYTTGRSIYFNLTLLAGEVATLNLTPTMVSFISNFRGNLMSTILPGSNLIFPLMPGANNLSAYMFGSTSAATAITATWQPSAWGLEGGVIR